MMMMFKIALLALILTESVLFVTAAASKGETKQVTANTRFQSESLPQIESSESRKLQPAAKDNSNTGGGGTTYYDTNPGVVWVETNRTIPADENGNPIVSSRTVPADENGNPITDPDADTTTTTTTDAVAGEDEETTTDEEETTTDDSTDDPSDTTTEEEDVEEEDVVRPASVSETAIFYVIADAPYSSAQAAELGNQIRTIPSDADFVVHLGDIRNGDGKPTCYESEYSSSADILKQSRVPVFIVIGDNDWNDCPNHEDGLAWWRKYFLGFETTHWTPPMSISRMAGSSENLSWIWKGTLFFLIGDLVGGTPVSSSSFRQAMSDNAQWVISLTNDYQASLTNGVIGQVVIFGHADPTSYHTTFFDPIRNYLDSNKLPVLFMNGDVHEWGYDTNFYEKPNFLRITMTGEVKEPPTKMMIQSGATTYQDPWDVFEFDRQLGSYRSSMSVSAAGRTKLLGII